MRMDFRMEKVLRTNDMLLSLFQYSICSKCGDLLHFSQHCMRYLGVIIVEKRLVMMSGGIAHTSYGHGVGLGYLLGFEPIIGALLISVLAALGIGYIKGRVVPVRM